ncbi:MAG: helix-turn-helix domain-containing protein [Acidimicrobiales bacterium]
MTSRPLTVHLPADVFEVLERTAEEQSLPLSTVVRRLTKAGLEAGVDWGPPPGGVSGDVRRIVKRFGGSAGKIVAELGSGDALSSKDLAARVGIHRGNVDRHLARLRDAGVVASGNGLHWLAAEVTAA